MPKAASGATVRLAGLLSPRARVQAAGQLGIDAAPGAISLWLDVADDLAIAERYFAPAESAALRQLPAEERQQAFLRCWTRKEAYLKARGDGIPGGLSGFDVSFAPGEPPALLRTLDDPDEARHWTLFDVAPAPGYTAAIAIRRTAVRLVHETFPPA